MVTIRSRRSPHEVVTYTMTDTEQTMADTEADHREPDPDEGDSVGSQADDGSNEGEAQGEKSPGKKSARRRISFSLRSLTLGAVFVALLGTIGVLTWLYWGAQHELDARVQQADNNTHAETIALDYAVNAAAMDVEDLNAWKEKLVAGTTPELKDKLTKAATSMEQILVPLQWSSAASPLVAKVRSKTDSTYVVDAFVSVQTKTTQAPEPLQSTAAYSITIDADRDWQISDVGGIGAMVEGR